MITIANDSSRGGYYFGSAIVYLNGVIRNDWRFNFRSIDESHIVTVACGPLQAMHKQFLPILEYSSDVAAIDLFAEFSEISVSYLVDADNLPAWNELLNTATV